MDSLLSFYTSLLRQNPKSEMAIKWCLQNNQREYAENIADKKTFSTIVNKTKNKVKIGQKNIKDIQKNKNEISNKNVSKDSSKSTMNLKTIKNINKKRTHDKKPIKIADKKQNNEENTKNIDVLNKKIKKLSL